MNITIISTNALVVFCFLFFFCFYFFIFLFFFFIFFFFCSLTIRWTSWDSSHSENSALPITRFLPNELGLKNIHQLLLYRGVRLSPPPISVVDITPNNLMVMFHSCWSFWESGLSLHCHCYLAYSGWMVGPERVLSMGLKEFNCVLMLNWIVWNRNVLTCTLSTFAKLNCLK